MSAVIFNEHQTQDGKKIVEIRLNAERSLNALTLDMIDLIQPKLDQCASDDDVVAILLDSEGEKAFCAGGDVVKLYKSMAGEGDADFPEQFFTREYRLDHTIHTYPKPVICWGSGIVMGGGIGLLSGCSHRVVTETTMMAMPEVTIGLYPDVGGSWFLNKSPGRTGEFMGLTGARMNAADALFIGLGDRFVSSELRGEMVSQLLAQDWNGDAARTVTAVLRDLEQQSQPVFNNDSPVREHFDLIQQLTDHDNAAEIKAALLAVETEDKWIIKAQKAIAHGSPLALEMIYGQLKRSLHLSLKEVFQQELNLSVQCCRHREFPEGVRALLVDKDGAPDWTFKTVEEVDPAFLEELFSPIWQDDEHPLADL